MTSSDPNERLSQLETQFAEMQAQLADIQRLLANNVLLSTKAEGMEASEVITKAATQVAPKVTPKFTPKVAAEPVSALAEPINTLPKQETPKQEAPKPKVPNLPPPPPKESEWVRWAQQQSMEFWLGRIGVGLFFIGLIFLFRYAVERGWITPWIRIAFGFASGLTLAKVGTHIWEERRSLSQIMLSGAIAVFYATIYAAYNWYALIPHLLAMALMTAVTAVALWYAWKLDEPIFSVIATIGGLATPFLLPTGTVNVQGLVAYLNVILVGASAVYWKKRWMSLLLVMSLGAILVYSSVLDFLNGLRYDHTFSFAFGDQFALQIGIIAMAILVCAIPLYLFLANNLNESEKEPKKALDQSVLLVAISFCIAFFVWQSVGTIWWMRWQSFGYFTVLYSFLVLFIAHFLYPRSAFLALPFGSIGAILLTSGLVMAIPNNEDALLFAMTLEALAFIFYDRWKNIRYVRYAGLGLWIAWALFALLAIGFEPYPNEKLWYETRSLSLIWLFAIGFATSFWLENRIERVVMRVLPFVGWIAWSCAFLPSNVAFALLLATAWGLYALYESDALKTENWQYYMHGFLGFLAIWMMQDVNLFGGVLYASLDLLALASMGFMAWKWENQQEAAAYRIVSLAGWALWCLHFLPLETAFLLILATAWGLYGLFRGKISPPEAWFQAQIAYWIGIALWIVSDAALTKQLHPVFHISGMVSIGAMAWLLRPSDWTRVFFAIQHLLFVVVTFSVFEKFANGAALITTCLGIYALAMFIVGIWQDESDLRFAGIGFGIFTIGKLFLFDLANLDSLVRILLFLGFGGVCLALSYYLPKLFKMMDKSERE